MCMCRRLTKADIIIDLSHFLVYKTQPKEWQFNIFHEYEYNIFLTKQFKVHTFWYNNIGESERKWEQFKSSIKLHQFITEWFMILINDNKLIKQTTLYAIPKNYIVLCCAKTAASALQNLLNLTKCNILGMYTCMCVCNNKIYKTNYFPIVNFGKQNLWRTK